jgi:hypothetical protein
MCRILPSARSQHSDLVGGRNLGVESLQLVQLDDVETEPSQAHLHRFPEVLGTRGCLSLAGPGVRQPALGGYRDAPVGVQGLADELLGRQRPARAGRVDEVDAELHAAAEHADRDLPVRGLVPVSRVGQPQGSESEAGHRHVAADREHAAGRRCQLTLGHLANLSARTLPPRRAPLVLRAARWLA